MSFNNFFRLFYKFSDLLQSVFLVLFKKRFSVGCELQSVQWFQKKRGLQSFIRTTGYVFLVFSMFTIDADDKIAKCITKIDSSTIIIDKEKAKKMVGTAARGECASVYPDGTITKGSGTEVTTETIDKSEDRNLCNNVRLICGFDDSKDKSGCEEAKEKFDEAKKEANTACSQFTSGIGPCLGVMRSCEDCPEEGGKKCTKLPSGAKCPQLAGDDLEELKEEIEDGKSTKEDIESDIKDLNDQILEKKGELAEAKQGYDEDMNTLQNELLEAQEEMEAAVKEKQTEIDDNLQKAISAVQGEMSKSLKIQHTFTNELAKASRIRRETKQKLYEKCRHTAGARLAAYRKYRRRAIREGRYGNKGVRKLMGKVRVSFTKQDNKRYQSYYSKCLSQSAPLFQSVEEDYRTALRVIEQKKEQILAQFSSLKAQLQELNNKAFKKKNQIVQDFAKSTYKAIKKFEAGQAQRTKQYKSEQQQFTMALMELEKQLQEKKGQLDAVNSRQGLNERLKAGLKKKGVSGDSSDEEGNVKEARAALANFRDTVEPVYNECCVPLITFEENVSASKITEEWEALKDNKDCTSFRSAFKNIYSSLKFENYTHEDNLKKMRRKMDMEHGSR